MKKEFIDFVKAMIKANPELAEELMTENVKAYLNALEESKSEKPELTDNGKMILTHLQSLGSGVYKSKEIADALFVSSRKISGGMRKLVADGFVEKVGSDPVSYTITEKGKNYKIEN